MEYTHRNGAHYATVELAPHNGGPAVVELRPAACPNGHSLTGTLCRVSWAKAPDHVMRRCWTCVQCSATVWGD